MFRKTLPYIIIIFSCLIFFYPVFLKGQVPVPFDFTLGVDYPWVDYKWPGYPTGIPVKNPLLADITSLTYPIKDYTIGLLKSGTLPLWDPLQFGGHPLIANFQSSVFYPLNFIYFLTEFVNAWTVLIILQPIMAAIFMFLLLKHLKLSDTSSVVGGLIYAFSGFNIIYLEYNNPGHVVALIPLLILIEDLFLEKPRFIFGLFISIILASQILAGYPQLSVYTLLLMGSWAIFRCWGSLAKEKLRLVSLFVYVILGLGLSGIQLVPGLELLRLSNRSFVHLNTTEQFWPIRYILTIFAPDYFGNPTTYNFWGEGTYINTLAYTGLVPLVLALTALIDKNRTKLVWFISLGALVIVFMAFNNPIALIHLKLIPGAAGSHLNRVLILFNLFVAILAAKGLDVYRSNKSSIYKALLLPISIIAGSFILTKILIYLYSDNLTNFEVGLHNLYLPAGLLLIMIILFVLREIFKPQVKVWSVIIGVVAIVELFRFGWKYEPFFSKTLTFPQTPVTSFLMGQSGQFRISGGDVIPISMWIPLRLESLAGFDGMYPINIGKLLAFMNSSDPHASSTGEYGILDHYYSPLINLANIKYITALKYDKEKRIDPRGDISDAFKVKEANFNKVFEDRSVEVLENKNALPRAFVVTKWLSVEPGVDTLQALNNRSLDLGKTIVLNQPVDKTQYDSNKSDVKYSNYSPNSSRLTVSSEHPGYLFVSDTFYPGWKAKVDNTNAPILEADYAFRAIPIEAGQHTVEMYYDPSSFKIGIWVSLISIMMLLLTKLVFELIKINPRSLDLDL